MVDFSNLKDDATNKAKDAKDNFDERVDELVDNPDEEDSNQNDK